VNYFISSTIEWMKRVVTQPRGELTRWQRMARYTYDLVRAGWKQLAQNRAPQMGAALAFRTLFALLPVVVVSTVVVRGFGGPGRFEELVGDVLQAMGANNVQVSFGSDATGAPITLAEWFKDLVKDAEQVNLAALGWIGFAVVIYSAIGLMVTIENSFNTIYGAPQGRSWKWRVFVYWALLSLGPILIGVAFFLEKRLGAFIDSVETWRWLLTVMKVCWGFVFAWLFVFVVYQTVPSIRIQPRSALIGAFIAALFLTIGKQSLGFYLTKAVSIQSLYGSLGLVPLFMFWVYLMWLAVLFGAEISAMLHQLGSRPLEEIKQQRPPTGVVDPASVLNVVQVAAEDFAAGQPSVPQRVSETTCIPEPTVRLMLDRLVEGGFLHRLDREDGGVALARPAQQISADQLMEIGFRLVDEAGVGRRPVLMDRLREAQRAIAAKLTLAAVASSPSGLPSRSHDPS